MFEFLADIIAIPTYPQFFWLTAVLGVLLVGIAKSGFGGGVGAVATPLVALTIPVADAAALLLPILIVGDIFSVRQYYQDADRSTLRVLIPAATIGIILGALFFNQFSENERLLKFSLGLITLVFVVYQMIGPRFFTNLAGRATGTPFGVIMGSIAGFTSTLAHVGGPPMAIYLLVREFPRKAYVGTIVTFFLLVNVIKLIPYGFLGLIRVGNISTTLLLIPMVVIGVQAGAWLNGRISEVVFKRIVYTLLVITALQLMLGQSLIGLISG